MNCPSICIYSSQMILRSDLEPIIMYQIQVLLTLSVLLEWIRYLSTMLTQHNVPNEDEYSPQCSSPVQQYQSKQLSMFNLYHSQWTGCKSVIRTWKTTCRFDQNVFCIILLSSCCLSQTHIRLYSMPDCQLRYYRGGQKNHLISTSEITSEKWYHCVQYCKCHDMSLISHTATSNSMDFAEDGLFKHAIYSWTGQHCRPAKA